MNYKKDFGTKASAIITEAFVFPSFRPGELPSLKYYTPFAAWDTGADHTSISSEVIEALQLKPKNYTTIMVFGGEQKVGVYDVAIALPNGKLFHEMEVYGADLGEYSILLRPISSSPTRTARPRSSSAHPARAAWNYKLNAAE